jgi:hypothetical protein
MVVFFYYLNYQLSGLDAFSYHATMVLFNVVNASLVFFLGRALAAPPFVAPLAGFLFLVFGGHAEAITWIAGMADPLVTMCVLVMMLLFLGALRAQRPVRFIVAIWVAFAAALLSKESAAMAPGILLAITCLAAPPDAHRRRWRVLAMAVGGMIVVAALYLALRTSVLGFTFVRLEGLGTNQHVIAMSRAFFIRAFLPQGELALTVFIYRLEVLVGIPLVVVLLWGLSRATLKPLALVALCIGFALAPVLPLSISLGTPESERLIYMASAFAMLWLVWFIALATQRTRVLVAIVAVLAVGNLVALRRINQSWEEAAGLIQTALPTFAEVIRTHGRPGRPVVFLNVPDNVRGAYVFRRGFHEALRLAAPDQLAALGDVGVLSVYAISDTTLRTDVTAAGPRSLDIEVNGGLLVGSPNPPTPRVALRDWSLQSFGADFTPASDGSLILYFTPHRVDVFGAVPF